MNYFVTHLKRIVKPCSFTPDSDDFVKDKIFLPIKDKELKAKQYRENKLILGRLIQFIETYYHKMF